MRTRWPILMLLCALASLLVPGIASASTAAGAENRVWAFDLQDQIGIGGSASLTLELHRGCEPAYDELASDSLLAARGGKGAPKPSPNFKPPTNSPQHPPAEVPPGWRVREMGSTEQYPNGYWKLEKPMKDGSWQPIDPSTMKPGGRPETHIPFPPSGG
jgi:hypothetical protein